jgi:hypothetical protein
MNMQQLMTHFTMLLQYIDLESGAHIQREVSHLFPCHTLQRMDILITKDGFQTWMDIVIINLTRTNMVQ